MTATPHALSSASVRCAHDRARSRRKVSRACASLAEQLAQLGEGQQVAALGEGGDAEGLPGTGG
jgi:hypothetical protein